MDTIAAVRHFWYQVILRYGWRRPIAVIQSSCRDCSQVSIRILVCLQTRTKHGIIILFEAPVNMLKRLHLLLVRLQKLIGQSTRLIGIAWLIYIILNILLNRSDRINLFQFRARLQYFLVASLPLGISFIGILPPFLQLIFQRLYATAMGWLTWLCRIQPTLPGWWLIR